MILAALDVAGKDIDRLTPDDLEPIDELHSRGREATTDLARLVAVTADETVLDVGCGIGGTPSNFGLLQHNRHLATDLQLDGKQSLSEQSGHEARVASVSIRR